MYEVEMKFRVPDPDRVQTLLAALGGRRETAVRMVDRYFNHPCRNFAETDEGLRIRQEGTAVSITYKGPLIDVDTKTRREIELDLAGSDAGTKLPELLRLLSFREVREVSKWREKWQVTRNQRDFEVAFDQVDGLGPFVELETEAREEDLTTAREELRGLAADLGLRDSERRGYLTLLLAQEENARKPEIA